MRKSYRYGVTLFELMLVLTIMGAAIALAAPSFARFFAGRALEEETRRLLGLTRYGVSQAISYGVPMELWIDSEKGIYGLSPAPGYEFDEKIPVVFYLPKDIIFDEEGDDNNSLFDEESASPFAGEREEKEQDGIKRTPVVMFWPDGTIDEYSRASLRLFQVKEEEYMTISLSADGLEYFVDEETEDR